MKPARRPKCRQSAELGSPPNRSARILAATVPSSAVRVQACLSQAWKLPGEVSTTQAGVYPVSRSVSRLLRVRSSIRVSWLGPEGRM